MKRLTLLAVSIAAVLALAGCGKAPESLASQATAALQAAEAAGAPQYAPDVWNSAKQAVDQMKAAIDAQAKRFSLFRSYGKATALAKDALRLSQEAFAAANAKKGQISDEAAATVAEVKSMLELAKIQLSKLPRIKGAATLKRDLKTAGKLLDQAQANLAKESFDNALAAASHSRELVTKVLKAIEKATGKSGSRKR